jgi:hypothetical protein
MLAAITVRKIRSRATARKPDPFVSVAAAISARALGTAAATTFGEPRDRQLGGDDRQCVREQQQANQLRVDSELVLHVERKDPGGDAPADGDDQRVRARQTDERNVSEHLPVAARDGFCRRRLAHDGDEHGDVGDVRRGVEHEQRHQAGEPAGGDEAAEAAAEPEAGVRTDTRHGRRAVPQLGWRERRQQRRLRGQESSVAGAGDRCRSERESFRVREREPGVAGAEGKAGAGRGRTRAEAIDRRPRERRDRDRDAGDRPDDQARDAEREAATVV